MRFHDYRKLVLCNSDLNEGPIITFPKKEQMNDRIYNFQGVESYWEEEESSNKL